MSNRLTPFAIGVVGVAAISVAIGAITGLGGPVPSLNSAYLLLVLWMAARHGWWPALWTAVLSFLVYDFFFIPPSLAFIPITTRDWEEAVLLLVFALAGGRLTASIASRMAEAAARARESGTLYDLAITALRDREAVSVLSNLCERARQVGQLTTISLLEVRPGEARTVAGDELSEDQQDEARRAYEERTDLGPGVLDAQLTRLRSHPPQAGSEYMVFPSGIAVLGLPARPLDETDRRLLAALLGLTSLVLDGRRMAAVMEEERERIARDIHDDTLQTLGAMALRLDLLREEIGDTRQREVIEQQLALARDSSDRLRSIVFELRSDLLEEGLATAIRATTRDQALQAGIEHRVTGRLTAEPPVEVAVALYRIAQEALTNVRKHGQARRVEVSLAEEGGALRLRVVDDGRGFDVAAATDRPPTGTQGRTRHFGLRSMSERARLVGGQLTVTSVAGQGTVVEARVPVSARTRPLTAG
ncbi:MAG: putative signal transduction histidine kinase [Chloroflexi bacterium]|nr:putative signal transduction histidine kinase [Chloroflexota bacterium]